MEQILPARGGTPEAQRDRAAATRAAILAAARRAFAASGYHAAATTEIVASAKVTRGALYHHFRDKEDLFEAVFMDATADLDRRGRMAVADWEGDLWSKLQAAFASHLRAVAESREFQRILLIDGPAVLGWKRCKDIQERFIARDTAQALIDLEAAGALAGSPPPGLPDLIQAALNDAALSIAYSADPLATGEAALAAFQFLLEGVRRAR